MLLFGLVAIVAIAACGDHELDQLTSVRDRACACHDVACAEAALADVPSQDVHPTPHAQSLANEIFRCVAHLRAEAAEAGGPGSSDDAGASDAGRRPWR